MWSTRVTERYGLDVPFIGAGMASIALPPLVSRFSVLLPTPDTTGDFEEMRLLSGESAGLARNIRPAGEIVRDMMAEAQRITQERLLPMAGKV